MSIGAGRGDNRLFRLDTDDDRGLVHAKAPGERDFWFGRFFRIWGQPPSSTQRSDRAAGTAHQITVTVKAQQFTGVRSRIVPGVRAAFWRVAALSLWAIG